MAMAKTVALLGALDTKGMEYAYVRDYIVSKGYNVLLIDVGVLEAPYLEPDITREAVAKAAGAELSELAEKKDRGEAIEAMSRGVRKLLGELYAAGRFQAVLALGGTGGTSVACAGMRELPVGVPKVMVSTVAGTDVSAYVGTKDITMIPSIVDVSGINRISREIFLRAAGAVCGMLEADPPKGADKPIIAASMFGNTTVAVEAAKKTLEQAGFEVIVFHCTGQGGKTMEALIESGLVAGVLDMTTTEWADELVGGVFSAGPRRLEAAARGAVPAIVVPGCLDMVNFGAPETVPGRFADRTLYRHNPNVTLMRTNIEENRELGRRIAEKLNMSRGRVTVLLPKQGLSVISADGGAFYWPEADQALFDSLTESLRPDIEVIERDCPINDLAFAELCARTLLNHLTEKGANHP
ncbi:Tm-1-like ATP-binding domain-containing protein [Paenibacillus piri]